MRRRDSRQGGLLGAAGRGNFEVMKFANAHEGIDRANLEQDRATAAALRRHPELMQLARERLAHWSKQDGEAPHPALVEWSDILFFLTVDQIADFLESQTPKANRLRQSSPFAGVLRRAAQLEKDQHATSAA